MALLIVDVSSAEGCCNVVGDPKLVAHFNQPSERASLLAALAASSCNKRSVCTAESAAAAKLSHLQKRAYCAKLIAKARKEEEIEAFNQAPGCWPARWHVPSDVPFANPSLIRAGDLSTVAGKRVKQIDALLEALATHAAEHAPSEQEMAACPACVTVPLLVCELFAQCSAVF